MFEDLFRSGQLEMSRVPLPPAEVVTLWQDLTVNRIAVIVAVFLLILDLPGIFRLAPAIWHCLEHSRGNVIIEHSMSTARARNVCAILLSLPFCLLASRFDLYRPAFADAIRPEFSLAFCYGILTAYLLVRHLLYRLLAPVRRMGQENAKAMHRSLYSYFTIQVAAMLVSTGLMLMFRVPDNAVRVVLTAITALFFVVFLIRAGQILASHCTGLSTFLYLCALELCPVGLLIAGALVF